MSAKGLATQTPPRGSGDSRVRLVWGLLVARGGAQPVHTHGELRPRVESQQAAVQPGRFRSRCLPLGLPPTGQRTAWPCPRCTAAGAAPTACCGRGRRSTCRPRRRPAPTAAPAPSEAPGCRAVLCFNTAGNQAPTSGCPPPAKAGLSAPHPKPPFSRPATLPIPCTTRPPWCQPPAGPLCQPCMTGATPAQRGST